jgi:hypothetical protein
VNVSDRQERRQPATGGGESGLTRQQRQRRARIAAHMSWANTADRKARTAAGTQAFLKRFERQVDPKAVLPDEVRSVMAQHARRAYMLQLAERSAAARRRRSLPKPPPPATP